MYVCVYLCMYAPATHWISPFPLLSACCANGNNFAPARNRTPVLTSFVSQRSHYTDPPHPQFSPHKHKSCLNICLQSASRQRPRDQQLPRQLLIHKIRPSYLRPVVAYHKSCSQFSLLRVTKFQAALHVTPCLMPRLSTFTVQGTFYHQTVHRTYPCTTHKHKHRTLDTVTRSRTGLRGNAVRFRTVTNIFPFSRASKPTLWSFRLLIQWV